LGRSGKGQPEGRPARKDWRHIARGQRVIFLLASEVK